MNIPSFKPTALAVLTALATFGASASEVVLVAPLVNYSIDNGEPVAITSTPGESNKTVWVIENYRSGDGNVQLSAFMDPDPIITSAISVLDLAAASNFNFIFALPIVPTVGPVSLKLTIGGSCTDADNNGCSVTPTLASGFLADGLLDSVVQVSGGSAFAGPAGGSGAFASSIFTVNLPAGPYNNLGLNLGFLGSGGGDAIAFTLGVEVQNSTVPEPGSLALVGLAAAGALAATRRRKQA